MALHPVLQKKLQQLFQTQLKALFLCVLCIQTVLAINEETAILQEEVEGVQKHLLEINRDLKILEEQLLFPNETQVAIFLSSTPKKTFFLDSIKLSINESQKIHHLYTERELDALARGATQKLYTGNLAKGKHQLFMVIIGRGPQGRPYRKAAELEFEKKESGTYVELQIKEDLKTGQPSFHFNVWH